MRIVLQQVSSATLVIEKEQIQRRIGKGIIIYLWIHVDDLEDYPLKIEKIIKKIPSLKCLVGDSWNIDTSLQELQGEILLVSNFTLFGRNHKGLKMDFMYSAPYLKAKAIYEYFIEQAKKEWRNMQTWEFWADMRIESVNEGPINYVFDF